MSAISASSASNTNPFPERTVLLPGSPATYANRAYLRGLGLRWDPVGHRWHGTTTADRVHELRERLGLEVRCFSTLEPLRGPEPPRPPMSGPIHPTASATTRARDPTSRFGDYSRTLTEARVVYRGLGEDAQEIVTPTRTFSRLDITSGLQDDSREADERARERRLDDLRGRVKAARAAITAVPGGKDALAGDWQEAAAFYARWGVTEAQFRHGVLGSESGADGDLAEAMEPRADWIPEVRAREVATLPESDRVERG